jgi:trans-aconitate 2-methyltransferase
LAVVTVTDWLLERPLVYRMWQLPFAERKLAPLLRRGEIASARRVLDVGCGPGTSALHFAHTDYLGVDINPEYVASARRRYSRRFVVADVTEYTATREGKFDFIFLNSLLHHLETNAVRRLLAHLTTLLTDEGHIHILDLVLPTQRVSISRLLARADRGNYPRLLAEWRDLFTESFDISEFEPYPLGIGGVTLWNMVYCKGRSRR